MRQGGLLKPGKDKGWIEVCPNCGWLVHASAFMPSVETMGRSFRRSIEGLTGADAISGLISCPKCCYYGAPLEVKEKDYPKLKFRNRKINPADSREAGHLRIKKEFAAGMLLLLAAVIFYGLRIYLTCCASVFIGVGLVLWSLFKKEGQRN